MQNHTRYRYSVWPQYISDPVLGDFLSFGIGVEWMADGHYKRRMLSDVALDRDIAQHIVDELNASNLPPDRMETAVIELL